MAQYKANGRSVHATRVPVALTTDEGLRLDVGDWLVIEKGVKHRLTNAEFVAAGFEQEATELVRHEGAAKKERHYLAKRGASESRELVSPEFTDRLKSALSGKGFLPARKNLDTGEISPAMTFDKAPPQPNKIKLDAAGNVIGVDVDVEEWPPKEEHF